jgi:hypothetical protein
VRRFEICFHDRANASDPAVPPPSCSQPVQNSNPAATAAFQHASTLALGQDFESSFERAVFYPIGVFAAVFVLVFFLPTPKRQPGWGAAAAPAGAGAGAGAPAPGGH